jgi:hypothetical protein
MARYCTYTNARVTITIAFTQHKTHPISSGIQCYPDRSLKSYDVIRTNLTARPVNIHNTIGIGRYKGSRGRGGVVLEHSSHLALE